MTMDDPEVQAFLERAKAELEPMITNSAVCMSVWSGGEIDPQMAIETGYIILMGKPLIVLKQARENVPAGLARAADAIVEYDNLANPKVQERVMAEYRRVCRERGLKEPE